MSLQDNAVMRGLAEAFDRMGSAIGLTIEALEGFISSKVVQEVVAEEQKKERSRWPYGMVSNSRGGKSRAWRRKG